MNQNPVSPKVTAATLATAVATILFIGLSLAGVFDDVDPAVITSLEGAVATVFAFFLGYLIKDENREQGKGVPPSRRG